MRHLQPVKEFSDFTLFNEKKKDLKSFGKVTFFLIPSGIRTHDLRILTHCTSMLDDNHEKETVYKTILDDFVYFDK